MEFLYKLYSNNYFGIGLFIVITILAFAFLVILFFGKKDEKARIAKELEKEKQLQQEQKEESEEKAVEEPNVEMATLEPITLEEEPVLESINTEESIENSIEESIFDKEPVLEETTVETQSEDPVYFEETPKEEMDPFVTSNIVLNTDYIMDEDSKEIEEQEDLSQTSDIYNLNSLINEEEIENNEEETIDDVLNKYDAIEETILEESTVETSLEENNPSIEEENNFENFSKPDDSIKMTSTPFSSVYLTKEEADTKAEEVIEESKPTMTSRAAFEMPKRVDLPKRSANAINENIISSLREDKDNNE